MQAHAPQAGSLAVHRHGGTLPDSSRKSWSGAEAGLATVGCPACPGAGGPSSRKETAKGLGCTRLLHFFLAEVKSFVQRIQTEPLLCARYCSRDWRNESLGAHGPHVLVNGEPQSTNVSFNMLGRVKNGEKKQHSKGVRPV